MSFRSIPISVLQRFVGTVGRVVIAAAISAGAAQAAAGGIPTAYQMAIDNFIEAARAEGIDLAPGPPQCLDFSNLMTGSKANADLPLVSCRVDMPCARLTLAGSSGAPKTFALSGHVDPRTCQEPRWSGYERAFATAYLRCDAGNGRTAALAILADHPVRLDDPNQPTPSDPRIEARPEAVAFQAACGAMTGIRRLQTTSDGRNEDIVLKPAVKP